MGLFSRKKYSLNVLTEEERGMLYAFWRNGWAAETRRQTGMPEGPLDLVMDKGITKALEKGIVDEGQLTYILAILKADLHAHPQDADEKGIIEKLNRLN